MGRFFKNILSSCLGTLLFVLLAGLILVLIGIATSPKPSYAKKSVLRMNLNMLIPEKSSNISRFEEVFDDKSMGMNELLDLLERAKTDTKIEGILLEASSPQLGMAKSLTIRKAIEDFRTSGKFVYAYASNYSQSGYYLCSVADSVYLNPNGRLDLRGMSVTMPYFKDAMDALGIKWNIYYAGQFKSATEPYRRTSMSEQNRQQLREFIEEISDNYILDIAKSRKIPVETVDNFMAAYAGFNPEKAVAEGFIDRLVFRDGIDATIRNKMELDDKKKIEWVDLSKYKAVSTPIKKKKSNDKIAVVYAEGDIVDTGDEKGMISADKYVETLSKIRKKKNIKAVVLRINSGGGSGFASEEIWREIELLKAEGKPIIISMGDYAASGGYYIACNADSIVASPNTLTGSIGVFAMLPDLKGMSEDKLKVYFDSVKTHPYANAFSPFFEFSEGEHQILQTYIDKFYEQFLSRVAEGRGLSRDEVHEIAQGRIWTGRMAKEIGLVDELGELDLAIQIGAEKAGLDNYQLTTYPKFKTNFVAELIKNMNLETYVPGLNMVKKLDQMYPYSRVLTDESSYGKPQALMPVVLEVD